MVNNNNSGAIPPVVSSKVKPLSVNLAKKKAKVALKNQKSIIWFKFLIKVLQILPLTLGNLYIINYITNNIIVSVTLISIIFFVLEVLHIYLTIDERILDPKKNTDDPKKVLQYAFAGLFFNLAYRAPVFVLAIVIFTRSV